MLSTVNQIGGAIGIAVLGTLFFTTAADAATGAPTRGDYGHALSVVLVVSAVLYAVAALVMSALPKNAAEHADH